MTDDIVTRLRRHLAAIEWEQPLAAERERLAADEIERLRAAGDALAAAYADAIYEEDGHPEMDADLTAWQEARRG